MLYNIIIIINKQDPTVLESPGFKVSVLGTGMLYYCYIVGPGCGPDTDIIKQVMHTTILIILGMCIVVTSQGS